MSNDIKYCEVEVVEGDTLWTIAKTYVASKKDIRETIFHIKNFNDMKSSYIYPGDIIKVPLDL